MGAEDHDFIGFFAAANLADDVFLLHSAADFVRHREVHAQACVRGHGSGKPHCILARDDSLRNFVDLAVERVGMPIEQQPLARCHPQDGRGATFDGASDDVRWLQVLVEQIGPGRTDVAMHEQDRATYRARADKFLLGSVSDVHERRFDSTTGDCRRPARRDQPHRKFLRPENLEPRVAFAPRHRQRVFFRVHIHTCGAKRRHGPFHCLLHLRRAGHAAADFIRQAP